MTESLEMLTATTAGPVFDRHQILHPHVVPRPADATEVARLAPWFALRGKVYPEVAIARYVDGGGRHAPETIAACKEILAGTKGAVALLYRHCSVQTLPLDPLLPSLLQAIGHVGPVHALRRAQGDEGLSPGQAELALVAAMMPPGGSVLMIDDLQQRVAPRDALLPAPVVLSLFLSPVAQGAARW